jgi:hypothetical protein
MKIYRPPEYSYRIDPKYETVHIYKLRFTAVGFPERGSWVRHLISRQRKELVITRSYNGKINVWVEDLDNKNKNLIIPK